MRRSLLMIFASATAVSAFAVAPVRAQAPAPAPAPAPAAQAPAPAGQAPAATPNARVFNSGSGLILYTIKADKAGDFEMVMTRTKEALTKSAKPERKQQAATWKVFKAAEAGAGGNVTYVMIMDPAVKDADYNIINILNEAFPTEVQALYKSYTESFASGLIPINLIPVSEFSK